MIRERQFKVFSSGVYLLYCIELFAQTKPTYTMFIHNRNKAASCRCPAGSHNENIDVWPNKFMIGKRIKILLSCMLPDFFKADTDADTEDLASSDR